MLTYYLGGVIDNVFHEKYVVIHTWEGTVMADKIQKAYQASKNIYDDVLTQGSIFSKMYIKIFWSGTDDNEIAIYSTFSG